MNETFIPTTTYTHALEKAIQMGFATANIYGMTTSLEEMLDDCRREPPDDGVADWIIIGGILCRAREVWQTDAEVYELDY